MVLTGGTSLRLAPYAKYRYSADLDHSPLDITENQAYDLISTALSQCRDRIGAGALELDSDTDAERTRCVGPLAAKLRTTALARK